VVLFGPFGPEKVKAHRTLVAMARALAAEGAHAVRFDHRGQGDSCGSFADFGFGDLVSDGVAALRYAAELDGTRRVAALGLRLGALLAALAAAAPDAPKAALAGLALWAPVLDARRHLYDMLRSNMATQIVQHGRVLRDRAQLVADMAAGQPAVVEGFPLTQQLMSEAEGHTLPAALRSAGLPTLLLKPARAPLEATPPPPPRLVRLVAQLGDEIPASVAAAAPVAAPFWQSFSYHRPHEPALFEATLTHLRSACDAHAAADVRRPSGKWRGAEGGEQAGARRTLCSDTTLPCGAERALRVSSGSGLLLSAVLHEAVTADGERAGKGDRAPVGVLLLNSGLLPRYCYHRHYVKLARYVTGELGLPVLRLDCKGLGDAAGELPEGLVQGRWQDIQRGLHVHNARDAATFCRQRLGWRRVVVGGSCGGAVTATLAAGSHPAEFAGVLALSLPLLFSDSGGPTAPLHEFDADRLLSAYLRKLLNPGAYWRLLTGKTDYKGLLLSLGKGTRRRLRLRLERARRAASGGAERAGLPWLRDALTPPPVTALPDDQPTEGDDGDPPAPQPAEGVNTHLLRRLLALDQLGVPVLSLMGALDRATDDFLRLSPPSLQRSPSGAGLAASPGHSLVVLPDTPHTFAEPEREAEAFRLVAAWLRGSVLKTGER